MELRRALLLFAIVLGLAAIATSVSRPADVDDDTTPETAPTRDRARPPSPTVRPRPAAGVGLTLRFRAEGRRQTRVLPEGRAATVEVEVSEPGQVELEGLGLIAAAEPRTPARFDVLADAGRHRVRFTPVTAGEARTVGTLRVSPLP